MDSVTPRMDVFEAVRRQHAREEFRRESISTGRGATGPEQALTPRIAEEPEDTSAAGRLAALPIELER
jgi:hypothetical protein